MPLRQDRRREVPVGTLRRQVLTPVLIVDDDPGTRAALASLLNFSGYTTVTVRSSEEGLTYLRGGGKASVVILDLGLPGMDGGAFRRTLLDNPSMRAIPVVVYSATNGVTVPDIVGFVQKTADPNVLLEMVAKACDKPLIERGEP